MRQFFSSMSQRARMAFAGGVLLIACATAAFAWWAMHPPYGVLFRDLRESDAAEITASLTQMQIPYRLEEGGKAIMVPDAQVYETRMKLVSQGVPKGGSVGFELFKDSDYGVTEFAQKVNFQRALQGELERTIASMDEVASSRVHLTIRRTDLFAREQEASKASVTLSLRPQKHVGAREVVGIQRLVASAVDGLVSDSVVVLDDKGMVLSNHTTDGQSGIAMGDRLDEQGKLETQMRARVGELLHRVLMTDDFTVSVDVRLNYDHVKQVREQLIAQGKDGNGLLVREKIGATGRVADESDPEHSKPGATSNDREVEYAHGREQEEVVQAPGRIERVSVGIVIPATLPQSELGKLSQVISAGLGLDASRGDKVDIAAIAPPEPVKPLHAVTTAASAEAPAAHLPASTNDPVTDAESDTTSLSRNFAPWMYPLLAVLALTLVIALLRGTRSSARRLSAQEREQELLRLRQWIEAAEVDR
ncbi:flagellar basal-body MS-ring/collar protein FliF [Dyella tabacisoli]|uniref:Flagellar M-ring protein n=1 Tax=Dyella tabacisoli TaxID=2282381 RepID=A0A369UMX3_9GAMM|nr:flagellar basal-body MS-ring/collar protein FliF [Dyella tabacisoli]RDD81425.1 flagellar M-ring protein FliF [Dyella tabacisoli]